MTNNDFYDARATDVLAAVEQGDMEVTANVVGQVLLEEGPEGLTALTEAVHRAKS